MNVNWTTIPNFHVLHTYGPEVQETARIVYDSRDVTHQAAFFCIIGEETDGHLYIEDAITRGATTIVGSNQAAMEPFISQHPHVTFVLVNETRLALAIVAAHFYDHPARSLKTIGVTGTNGKTTVATYVKNLLDLVGVPCGLIGTNGIFSSQEEMEMRKSTPTTPMQSDMQYIFRELVRLGDQAASMEVSSIALDQHRVGAFTFDVAIHTNISEEHMEYHGTFEHYLQSKLKLFKQAKHVVVNLDDDGMSKEILDVIAVPSLTYSMDLAKGADLTWTSVSLTDNGLAFDLHYNGIVYPVEAPIFGNFNAGNLVSAIATLLHLGIDIHVILGVLENMSQVSGRFQVINGPEDRKIIIDYAHTPVALASIMKEIRKLPHEKFIAMVCGIGIRDFGKMPKMAKAAEGLADEIVVSVDHPGHNDPWDVVDAVMAGFSEPALQPVYGTPSRKDGVLKALELSEPGDIILLSSGCINGCQIVRGEYIPHSDEEIIETYFKNNTTPSSASL
ncbi:UDP-N-acetylmuramoyl-L-alanyl-D-glutamate--2,6-diaminopimelate ligase [Paenisporosarcina cavernae]|uniref:UDP-N-acetylmuramoyl-L-alanyl-D-glutamate--2, 6-diaminopimelate ligase n=1 Tax=Paenisporosarcina cavernae TaxID=2320858 RepID=A0A385YSA6_9BACL|nr:UDP-N-acetylmuramoyl-L-alanyl-D-glutamate--2,6-diaminopimelate ligase [Paenisporosarcina cavernae]AYC28867.1 UDP-N-acetylmuramoyl-L-alanyl-D-glutamate--2,6-diaminopimelate ligase [Paenisporosarcina cavernae]